MGEKKKNEYNEGSAKHRGEGASERAESDGGNGRKLLHRARPAGQALDGTRAESGVKAAAHKGGRLHDYLRAAGSFSLRFFFLFLSFRLSFLLFPSRCFLVVFRATRSCGSAVRTGSTAWLRESAIWAKNALLWESGAHLLARWA